MEEEPWIEHPSAPLEVSRCVGHWRAPSSSSSRSHRHTQHRRTRLRRCIATTAAVTKAATTAATPPCTAGTNHQPLRTAATTLNGTVAPRFLRSAPRSAMLVWTMLLLTVLSSSLPIATAQSFANMKHNNNGTSSSTTGSTVVMPASTTTVANSSATTSSGNKCFSTTTELYTAIDALLYSLERRENARSNKDSNTTTTNNNTNNTTGEEADASTLAPQQHSAAAAVQQIYGPVETWCVGQLTNFSHALSAQRNPAAAVHWQGVDLAGWDTSRAMDMRFLFDGCALFAGQGLGGWNVSRVQHMDGMFRNVATAVPWEGDLSGWSVEKVVTADRMFQRSKVNVSERNDLSQWKWRSLQSARHMFDSVIAFQWDLCAWGDAMMRMPGEEAVAVDVTSMFATTACFYRGQSVADPVLTATPPGPFCHVCDPVAADRAVADSRNSGGGSMLVGWRSMTTRVLVPCLGVAVSLGLLI